MALGAHSLRANRTCEHFWRDERRLRQDAASE